MERPDAHITVFLGMSHFNTYEDPLSDRMSLPDNLDQIYVELYDILTRAFEGKCGISLSVQPKEDGYTQEVLVQLESGTGDVYEDTKLKELLYDTTLRSLETIIDESMGIETTSDSVHTTLYIIDPKGKSVCSRIDYQTTVDRCYTFYTVIPEGMANTVAVLSSAESQYIDTDWHRPSPLTAMAIFDAGISWYNAHTREIISGGLAIHLRLKIENTLL